MLYVDIHEPESISTLIGQSVPTRKIDLNTNSIADYLWLDINSQPNQVERKKPSEILGDLNHVEGQLLRQMSTGGRLWLLTEGFFAPHKDGCSVFRYIQNKNILVPYKRFRIPYASVQAWYDSIQREGINLQFTSDEFGTAVALVATYNNSRKRNHTTFNRYITEKVVHRDPQVAMLIGMCKAGGLNIGESRATALIEEFGDIWTLLSRTPEDLARVEGVGINTARKLLTSVGRKLL